MTRFKELARIQSALKHRHKSELQWSLWYCEMRRQIATRKHHLQYWREMQRKVAHVLDEIGPEPDGEAMRKRKSRHWQEFIETPSIRKSRQRSKSGLCIGCGKHPCECSPRSKKA